MSPNKSLCSMSAASSTVDCLGSTVSMRSFFLCLIIHGWFSNLNLECCHCLTPIVDEAGLDLDAVSATGGVVLLKFIRVILGFTGCI